MRLLQRAALQWDSGRGHCFSECGTRKGTTDAEGSLRKCGFQPELRKGGFQPGCRWPASIRLHGMRWIRCQSWSRYPRLLEWWGRRTPPSTESGGADDSRLRYAQPRRDSPQMGERVCSVPMEELWETLAAAIFIPASNNRANGIADHGKTSRLARSMGNWLQLVC